ALGAPIDHVAVSRSTMRGSAVLALEQAAPDVAPDPVPVRERVEPVAAHADYYRERLERFEQLADLACMRPVEPAQGQAVMCAGEPTTAFHRTEPFARELTAGRAPLPPRPLGHVSKAGG